MMNISRILKLSNYSMIFVTLGEFMIQDYFKEP